MEAVSSGIPFTLCLKKNVGAMRSGLSFLQELNKRQKVTRIKEALAKNLLMAKHIADEREKEAFISFLFSLKSF